MNRTIAAISTAYGRGGIAVIRISGSEAIEIASEVFFPSSGKKLAEYPAGRVIRGEIRKRGCQIDDGLCTVFRCPTSYTGEDVVEISCHGGILLTQLVLEAVFEAGAVPAEAGEFTKRAFINGKISLSQAEAIGILIDAETDEGIRLAASQERGIFSKKVDELYEKLKLTVTNIYAAIDFPEEDLSELSLDEIIGYLCEVKDELEKLSSSYSRVRAACEGIRTVIAGKPNTGKSSLLNRLVGRERAIVTEIAGTTRDTVEESISVGKVLLRLCDTAGIHSTEDKVEKLGILRSLNEISEAELILAIFDRSNESDKDDTELISHIKKAKGKKIAVINKCDLPEKPFVSDLACFDRIVEISAANGDGIDRLTGTIEEMFAEGEIDYDKDAVVLNARQNSSVRRALENINNAVNALRTSAPLDAVAMDMQNALSELSELDGRQVSEEIVSSIFAHFCVGK